MFKVNNKDFNFEYISHLVLMFLLLTLNKYFAGWDISISRSLSYITDEAFLQKHLMAKFANYFRKKAPS